MRSSIRVFLCLVTCHLASGGWLRDESPATGAQPAPVPAPRHGVAAIYDRSAGRVIIFGGVNHLLMRPNDMIGVTTAWARRSERAWARTHRVAGYTVVALGLVIIVSTFLVRDHLGWLVGTGVGATALLLALVSLLNSRKEDPHAEP